MNTYAVTDLTKIYPRGNIVANDGLNFTIAPGEIFGLLGPNGAGKTTLIRQLLGLVRPTGGSIHLFGTDIVNNASVVPHYVSYLSQRPGALADLRVMEALTITGHLRFMSRSDAANQAAALVEQFDLGEIRDRTLGRLSGGQARLVSLAMALIGDLPVLILDEPTNDLDPQHRKQLWEQLLQINRRRDTTIILVTHNVVEAERVLSRVGIINRGRIMALGTVEDLKSRIDNRLRVEVTFRESADPWKKQLAHSMLGEVLPATDNRFVVLADRRTAPEDIRTLLNRISPEAIRDLRILTPTLEDVYLQLGGGESLGA